jgi:hypothetical protein
LSSFTKAHGAGLAGVHLFGGTGVLGDGSGSLILTQYPVEVVLTPTNVPARLTQLPIEALVAPANELRVTQYVVEVLTVNPKVFETGFTLYLSGSVPFSTYESGCTLFEQGQGAASGGHTLFICNAAPTSGHCTLFLDAHPYHASGHHTLYIQGSGHTPSGGMPLYIEAPDLRASGHFPLYLWATAHSGLYDFCPLSIQGTGTLSAGMPLFIGAPGGDNPGSQPDLHNLNLFIEGGGAPIDGQIPLYLANVGVEGNVTLFLQGDGITDGALPLKAGMPLYINGGFGTFSPHASGIEASTTLYLQGPGTLVSTASGATSISLFVDGHAPLTQGMTLALPGVVATPKAAAKLYTHGF